MAMVFSLIVGAIFGLFIGGVWLGVDLLFDLNTLSEAKMKGVMLLSVCTWFGAAAIMTLVWG